VNPVETWQQVQERTFSGVHIGKTEERAKSLVFQAVKERVRGRVLDVGCGDGGIVAALVDAGVLTAGLDLPEVVAVAQKRHPHLVFFGADVAKVEFFESIDTVLLMDIIEHVEDDLGLLRRLQEIAPRVIITTPSHDYKWKEAKEHLRFFPSVAMARLVAVAGMVLIEHLRIFEEDTNIFVCERSNLPLGERLELSVAAVNDSPMGMGHRPRVVDEQVNHLVRIVNGPVQDWESPVWLAAYQEAGNLLAAARTGLASACVLGAAGGSLAASLLELGLETVIMDRDLWALVLARARIGENPKTRYVIGDPNCQNAENLGMVVCHDLDHEPDPLAVVRAVRDSLAPGGVAAIIVDHPTTTVPGQDPAGPKVLNSHLTFGGPAYSFNRLRTYTEEELREKVGKYLDVCGSKYVAGKDYQGRDHALTIVVGRRK